MAAGGQCHCQNLSEPLKLLYGSLQFIFYMYINCSFCEYKDTGQYNLTDIKTDISCVKQTSVQAGLTSGMNGWMDEFYVILA